MPPGGHHGGHHGGHRHHGGGGFRGGYPYPYPIQYSYPNDWWGAERILIVSETDEEKEEKERKKKAKAKKALSDWTSSSGLFGLPQWVVLAGGAVLGYMWWQRQKHRR